jgi:hypothetical protein
MSRLAPFAGWAGGTFGWFLSDQLGSSLANDDCVRADPVLMALIGLGGALIVLAGALVSLHVWHRSDTPVATARSGPRALIAGTGLLACGIFLLAILFQTISSFVIPRCFG